MNDINNQLETGLNDINEQLGDLPKPRFDWKELPNKVGESARTAAHYADDCVQNHTWSALALALGVGFAVGALLRQRD